MQQLTSVVNYGGRITDDKDMRTSDILIADYLTPKVLTHNHAFSGSGFYLSIDADPIDPVNSYLKYIDTLPLNADPEIFGMHSNASITTAMADVDSIFGIILALQPRVVSSKLGDLFDRENVTKLSVVS